MHGTQVPAMMTEVLPEQLPLQVGHSTHTKGKYGFFVSMIYFLHISTETNPVL
jgi:hypothetical protein